MPQLPDDPVFLRRASPSNIACEVQRWQAFLLGQGFTDSRRVDGDFGGKTEDATRRFQAAHGLSRSGALDGETYLAAMARGYRGVERRHYEDPARQGDAWPPRPTDLSTPGNADRNRHLTCFLFDQSPEGRRITDELDGINVAGSCDGRFADWAREFVMDVPLPRLAGVPGLPDRARVHRKVAPFFVRLWEEWEKAGLLHLVISYSGDYLARYKRGKSPDPAGHGRKSSADVTALSNHAFGTAFDINVPQNDLGKVPAFIGTKGCVRELVPIANACGFFWGGHFQSPRDGMHFEFADFGRL